MPAPVPMTDRDPLVVLGRRLRAILSLFVGAAVGAFMVLRWGLAPPLALAGATVLVFTLALARDEARKEA
jgi:uncharacterized membrane protein YoaK (UPF0700 family)